MRGLNPDLLRTFIEVVEQGSFTGAARRLNLSQPAVSLQIRELESRCDVQLLDRRGKTPYPTEAGRQMLVHANRILTECDEAVAAMRRLRNASGQKVRVGMSMTTLSYVARDVIRRFQHDNPKADLVVSLMPSMPLVDELKANTIDIAVVSLPIDETYLDLTPFHEEPVMALLPEDRFSSALKEVHAEQLTTIPFVVQETDGVQIRLIQDWFRQSGHAALRFVEVCNLEACRAAVAAGLGVSIVPASMTKQPSEGVLALPLNPPIKRRLALAEPKKRAHNAVTEKLRKALLACGTGAVSSTQDTEAPAKVHTLPLRRATA